MSRTDEIKKRTIGLVGEDTVTLSVHDYNYLISKSERYDKIIDQCLAESFDTTHEIKESAEAFGKSLSEVNGEMGRTMMQLPANVSEEGSG
ncbi:hypothetical protein [Priestia aryabhattai]|uniref:hypothetical protein n=1 Tax=Priestia aryabhattai TaxID=412384 RepID=UPI003C8078A9